VAAKNLATPKADAKHELLFNELTLWMHCQLVESQLVKGQLPTSPNVFQKRKKY
jgi:hypothetical protein